MKTSKQLAALAIVTYMLVAAACADSTAPRRDCPVPSNGQVCVPG